MEGFFFDDSVPVNKNLQLSNKRRERALMFPELLCEECSLYKRCNSPKMEYTGEGRLKCLIIAEAPGEKEDALGKQLVGKAGNLLRLRLKILGLDLDKDFWKINAVNCHIPFNRKPKDKEINCCWNYLVEKTIKKLKPKVIWLFGEVAANSYFKNRFGLEKRSISKWRRWCIPDYELGCWVIPLFHPSYILRNQHDVLLSKIFDRDLVFAKSCFSKEAPVKLGIDFIDSKIKKVVSFREVVSLLRETMKKDIIAFDYETSGLKPYHPEHRIWSISVAWDNDFAFAIPYQYTGHFGEKEQLKIKSLWSRILENPNIKKIAHNLKYEDHWSSVFFTDVKGWYWDTMVNSHILDNRGGISSLKFQTFIRYGIVGYETEVKKYMTPLKGSVRNRLDEFPLRSLLKYNAQDSLFTMWIYNDQAKILNRDKDSRKKARLFFHKGILALSQAEKQGWCVDVDYYNKKNKELEDRLVTLESELLNHKASKEFKKRFRREPKIRSTRDLPTILYDILNLTTNKLTATGAKSVDKTVIQEFANQGNSFCEKLLEYRMIDKAKNTYLHQFKIEVSFDNKIHPVYNLHIPKTYRSSCSNPNAQNLPIRIDLVKKIVRGGIIPSPGHKILEGDFGSLEVRIGACIHKDPNMIRYILESGTDMHRDTACDIWMLKPENVSKKIRFFAKNCWVFPQFYGDWYKSCAYNLWENCLDLKTEDGVPLKEHLKTCKVSVRDPVTGVVIERPMTTYDVFEEHCHHVENIFWKERFKIYDKWKTEITEFYRDHGYIETPFGFRLTSPMSKKECSNYPVQGCLQGHCKVLTSKGEYRIDSLVNKVVKVWTGFEWKPAIGVNRGKCRLATVTLESGLKLDCDIRHEFKDVHLEWVKFEDLKVGDYIALPNFKFHNPFPYKKTPYKFGINDQILPTDLYLNKQNLLHKIYNCCKFPVEIVKYGIKNIFNSLLRNSISHTLFDKSEAEYICTRFYCFDKVKDIQIHKEKDYTYTMSVNDNLHQFVADGIICKNTAFHCLLWSFIELINIQRERKWKSKLIGQIHDSIIVDLCPDEQDEVIETMEYIMTKKLVEENPWIIVPLEVDFEITGINEPWSEKTDLVN